MMQRDRIDDALDGLSAREVEEFMVRARRRLQRCVACGSEGAEPVRVRRGKQAASLMLCPACFERHRLPEGRSASA
jgi:hypothetical protein